MVARNLHGFKKMPDPEMLLDLTESYLKSLIAEASASLGADFDSSTPFGELGIDSFRILKIIKALERTLEGYRRRCCSRTSTSRRWLGISSTSIARS